MSVPRASNGSLKTIFVVYQILRAGSARPKRSREEFPIALPAVLANN